LSIEIEQRDARGRFTPGNTAAVGRRNPRNTHTWALRDAFDRAVLPQDLEEVANCLVERAKSGDIRAVIALLDRCLGKADSSAERSRMQFRSMIQESADKISRVASRHLDPEVQQRFLEDLLAEFDEKESHD